MIVRTLRGLHYLIRQGEHARQSGVIAAALREEFLGPGDCQLFTVRATAHHDAGWESWDLAPRRDDSGLPVRFTAMERPEHLEIWRRAIFQLVIDLGPAAAAVLARHAVSISTHVDKPDEQPDYAFHELIPVLQQRAWPGMAQEESDFLVARGFAALSFADALSLIACAGWDERLPLTLLREDRTPRQITAWRDGDWTVRVDPWPFCTETLPNVHVDAVVVPEGSERHALPILQSPRDHLVRMRVDYLPRELP